MLRRPSGRVQTLDWRNANVAQNPLAEAIKREIMNGGTVVYQDEDSAILQRGQPVSHKLHGIMSWPFAFWYWYWIYVTIKKGIRQVHLSVADGSSVVSRTELKEVLPLWVKVDGALIGIFQVWFLVSMLAARWV